MSSYFDEATRTVSDLCQQHHGMELVKKVAEVENEIIEQVNLNTGDREFPADLREKIQSCIAQWNVGWEKGRPGGIEAVEWHKKAWDWLFTVKTSRLIDDLHSLYHQVASRRIKTRFGMLYDSPRGNNKMRDEWDKEQSG